MCVTRLLACAALTALLLVAACSDEPAPESGQAAAPGEVLEGSISDEMIPFDLLRSQPPLEEVVVENTARGGEADAPSAPAVPADPSAGEEAPRNEP